MTDPVEDGKFGGLRVAPGTRKDIRLKISESFSTTPVFIPVTVVHGVAAGPRLFITAAVHGNEINGVEIVRQIRTAVDPKLLRGTLVLVPIANPIGFVSHQRDLPDGRDLNRCFPGSPRGSLTSQVAHVLFNKVVKDCDFGIDLHTAALGRTNLPHVRADMRQPVVRRLACGFGAEVVLDTPGEPTMLRAAASRAGVSVIVYEAGEPMKFQASLIEKGVAGIKNVLAELGMYAFPRRSPPYQLILKDHKWIRARRGGILILQVRPGVVVRKGEQIAYNTKPYGTEVSTVEAPYTGICVAVSTVPMVYPGTAICHILRLHKRQARMTRLFEKQYSSVAEE